MATELYSLRMRATGSGRHLSGAERIVESENITTVASQLIARAMRTQAGSPDDVRCRIERLDPAAITRLALPEVATWLVPDYVAGRSLARLLLTRAGVSPGAIATVIETLTRGAAPGGEVMRGAMIIDAISGERLEENPARGVRVSRMDLAPEFREQVEAALADAGLSHHRVAEALILAGKVLHAPGLVAELCWSDAPDYVTGYVADHRGGYQRISHLKAHGDRYGGRAFFVDRAHWWPEEFIDWMERRPVLFESLTVIHPPRAWTDY